jgi:hypothetical protein
VGKFPNQLFIISTRGQIPKPAFYYFDPWEYSHGVFSCHFDLWEYSHGVFSYHFDLWEYSHGPFSCRFCLWEYSHGFFCCVFPLGEFPRAGLIIVLAQLQPGAGSGGFSLRPK